MQKIFLTGQMGVGKTWAAIWLREHEQATRWSRTELMKRLAHAVADHLGDPDEMLARMFSDPDERAVVLDDLLTFADTYEQELGKPRILYQRVTEICQEHDPDCFERELMTRIEDTGPREFTLIDDVRTKAAYHYYLDRDYASVRFDAPETVKRARILRRDGYLPAEAAFHHPSETELTGVPHHFQIYNDTDNVADLYAALSQLVTRLRSGDPLPALGEHFMAAAGV